MTNFSPEREAEKAKRLGSDYIEAWWGFDLDGTLAVYDTFQGYLHIGEPIEPMIALVHAYLAEGKKVKIFTARASEPNPTKRLQAINAIEQWCFRHIGEVLPITCIKDYGMVHLYDDRCTQVVKNEGRLVLPLEEIEGV